MAIYYVDLENGDDANSGLDFASRKKTLSFTSSVAYGSEVRVMASESPTSIGNAKWHQQQVTKIEPVYYAHDEGGLIKIQLTSNYAGIYPDNGYVKITDCTAAPALNGIWKTTNFNNEYFTLNGSNFSDLGISSGSSVGGSSSGARIQSIGGRIVEIAGEQVRSIDPSWTVVTIANPSSAWVNTGGGNDGVIHNGAEKPGGGAFQSRPQSSWRISWSSSNNSATVSVTEKPYYDARASAGSWSNNYSSYWGAGNSYIYLYLGFVHRFSGTNAYYTTIQSNSYINVHHYSSTNNPGPTSPYYRNYQIGAKDSEMYRVRSKTLAGNSHSNYSDLSTSNGKLIWYSGNRQDSSVTTNPGDGNYEIEWTAYFFNGGTSNNRVVQIDIHENVDWTYQTLAPSFSSTTGYTGGAGTQFDIGGTPANTTVFWENFGGAINLSNYDSLSLFLKKSGTVPNNFKLRLHEGTYDSGASYTEFALPMDTVGDWTSVSLSTGSNLPSNVLAISIHYDGTSNITDSASFSISDMMASSSTGLNYGSFIGRNTADSPHWYKIQTLRYDGSNTLATLKGRNNTTESTEGGISYFGSVINPPDLLDVANCTSDTVTTYVKKPITLTSGISVTRDRIAVRGGWNRTDMSTQTGDTFVSMSATSGYVMDLRGNSHGGLYVSNFHTAGGGTGFHLQGFTGSQLENCSATYADDYGCYQIDSYYTKLGFKSVLANNSGLYYRNCKSSDVFGGAFEGNFYGIQRAAYEISDICTYDVVIRGSEYRSMHIDMAIDCYDFNPHISGNVGNIYYVQESRNIEVFNGYLRIGKHYGTSTAYYLYSYYDPHVAFTNCDMPENFNMSGSYIRSRDTKLSVTGPGGNAGNRVLRYWQNGGAYLQRKQNLLSPTGLLPDGTTDPGNKCYRWHRISTSTYNYGPNAWGSAPRMKLGELPVSSGTTVSVTAHVYQNGGGYGKLRVYCDAWESTIGLTGDDPYEDFHGSSSIGQWHQYTLTFSAITSGVAQLYMTHWVEGSNTTGSNTEVYFTNLEITGT